MKMRDVLRRAGTGFAMVVLGSAAAAQETSNKSYVFGNSLVHHLSDSDETTVPHWLAVFAKKAGKDFALDGQWGFLRDFRKTLPPQPNWSFKQVKNAWRSERTKFEDIGYSHVWITPANFIQYQAPNDPFDGENVDGSSPASVASDIFRWTATAAPDAQLMIYEGWPEMGAQTGRFPPNAEKLAEYHAFAQGPYHQWYLELIAEIRKAEPNVDPKLIPVSKILSGLMSETALSSLDAEVFYADDAPHGTATLYMLAAMVTYSVLYNEPAPEGVRLPASIAPEIRASYGALRSDIWARVQSDRADMGAATPQAMAATVDDAAQSMTPAKMTPMREQPVNPSLAMGLNGIADWSVQHPFVDLMKTARTWVGHKEGQWGAYQTKDLIAGGYFDDKGWPKSLPDDATQIEAFLLTDQPVESVGLTGRYIMRYSGEGDITVGGRAQNVDAQDGEISFDYEPGEGLIAVTIRSTDPNKTGDYIRDIQIFREAHAPLIAAGVVFNPAWINRIDTMRSVRFMDWMGTNGSEVVTWDDRPQVSDYSYTRRGVPIEIMVQLSNEIAADPWFNMPHKADDDFIRQFAEYVRDTLRPNRKAYVEYSNEVWNFIFPQAQYALAQSEQRWGKNAADDQWMQFAGMRAAQMAKIWTEVFGSAASERLVPVIGTHTGWIGLEEGLMNAPLWVEEDPDKNWPPYVYFKGYAVTGYFGFEMGGEEMAPKVLEWLDQAERIVRNDAAIKSLIGAERDAYLAENRYKAVDAQMEKALLAGSVKELNEVIFVEQAKVAESYGLQLLMYEGGTHVAVHGEWSANEQLIEYFKHFNYSQQMANIYTAVLNGWKASGGTLFNAFVDVSIPSQYGSWGALRHLDDDNLRWAALNAFNENTPGWWDARAQDAFVNGRTMLGGPNADELEGTLQNDLMVAGAGDDVLITKGGINRLFGGDGTDAVLLPGEPSDYSFSKKGEQLNIRGKGVQVLLDSVEMLWFEGDEELAIMVDDLL